MGKNNKDNDKDNDKEKYIKIKKEEQPGADYKDITSIQRNGKSRLEKFHFYSLKIIKADIMFLMLFVVVYHIIIPLIAMLKGIIDPNVAPFDMLIGAGLFLILFILFEVVHTRVGLFFAPLAWAYWWIIPSNWILNDDEIIVNGFGLVYDIFGVIWLFNAFITLLSWINLITQSFNLKRKNYSVFLGPWFSNIMDLKARDKVRSVICSHKKEIKKALIGVPIILVIALSGLLSYFDIYSFRVKITPKHYDVTFNFWANPQIDGNYSEEMQQKYGLNESIYRPAVKEALNKHHVNLDLTFGRFDYKDVALLKKWEAELPNITYRIVLAPGNLSDLAYEVFHATDILMECEQNGTLDQWVGFCFDIEGRPFQYKSSFNSIEEAAGMWDTIFDFIDKRSAIRGKTIEMECVSDYWPALDIKFDGDHDIHAEHGLNEYYPERFTTYAPMIYRCWYKGEIPFGSPEDPHKPWPTSYEVYSSLYELAGSVPSEKVGVYLGITNCSCYGRDLPQPEPYTWPTNTTNTGLTNLYRDVLIAKSFGIKEVTFFLLWTAIENNYSMAGVFDAYGKSFLDDLNYSVNTNPPDSFYIFFKYSDARNSDIVQKDWVYDFNRPKGLLELTLLVAITIVIINQDYKKLKRKINRNDVGKI
ncbi:MAG: hypothetical protein ACTSVC_08435 [Promethearchaeota archaeon]